MRDEKVARCCGAKHISKSKYIIHRVRTTYKVQMWFCVAGARDSAPYRSSESGISKNNGRRGTVQETCSAEMLGGQGGDFLRRVAFGASDLQVCKEDFVVTYAPLHMTWPHFFVAGAVH